MASEDWHFQKLAFSLHFPWDERNSLWRGDLLAERVPNWSDPEEVCEALWEGLSRSAQSEENSTAQVLLKLANYLVTLLWHRPHLNRIGCHVISADLWETDSNDDEDKA